MSRSLLLIIAIFTSITLSAQLELEGLWEGTIMIGGIESTKGLPLKMYLLKSGRNITGRTYIFINDRVIEAEVEGYLYQDLSVDLKQFNFIKTSDDAYIPPFLRKFQLSWNRGINGSSLNGYWQEIVTEIFDPKRQRGRVYLRKVTNQRA